MPVDLNRRQFTVAEFHAMGSSRLFEGERVELVEGEVVTLAPKGSRHAACVTRLVRLLTGHERPFLVRVQDPLVLSSTSEVEPDVAIVRPRKDFYADRHPEPVDVLLVIEVAESSLEYDREVKLPLYARAGVPEVWIVDLTARVVTVHSSPAGDGYEILTENRSRETLGSSLQLEFTVLEVVG